MSLTQFETVSQRDRRWHLHSQTNLITHESDGPLIIAQGDGPYVIDSNGNRYLDAMAGLWCASLGFCNPRLTHAASRAYETMGFYHTFSGRSSPAIVAAAEAIGELLPIEDAKIYFATSGSEANETMVKFAWLFHAANGEPQRRKIISRKRSFHGSTIAAASMTGLPHMHREFGLPLAGFIHTEAVDLYHGRLPGESADQYSTRLAQALENLILKEGPETIAAMIAEPVQAGAGILVPPKDYFGKIAKILERYGILLLDDEIVCGFGRTGSWFGCETVGMAPDMMSMAKGLSAGHFPISAVAISPRIYEAIRSISAHGSNLGHGFTNSGHPVGGAIVAETLLVYREMNLPRHTSELGARLFAQLREIADKSPVIGDARGVGMLAGFELVADKHAKRAFAPEVWANARLEQIARDNGLMLRMQGDTITFCPPFILTNQHLDEIQRAFAATLHSFERDVREVAIP
ncbi:aminotransferase [Rhizobium sp. RCAM05973]|uniref:aminotransferase n=1 Tax=Rhizobium sp. RCAM05973 TaxID=2994066 RepID=UPI0022EBBE4E|nr:aminotransferase [Rhizobium sp. RCAM05973]